MVKVTRDNQTRIKRRKSKSEKLLSWCSCFVLVCRFKGWRIRLSRIVSEEFLVDININNKESPQKLENRIMD